MLRFTPDSAVRYGESGMLKLLRSLDLSWQRPGDPHDIGAVFFALGSDAHQLHDPDHVVSTSVLPQIA
jgi:hypothetical protein